MAAETFDLALQKIFGVGIGVDATAEPLESESIDGLLPTLEELIRLAGESYKAWQKLTGAGKVMDATQALQELEKALEAEQYRRELEKT